MAQTLMLVVYFWCLSLFLLTTNATTATTRATTTIRITVSTTNTTTSYNYSHLQLHAIYKVTC